jgi:hypothetical protein
MSAILADRCTRCTCVGYIKARGTLEFGVPYALCANCSSVYQSLNLRAAERFAQDVWRRSVEHSPRIGSVSCERSPGQINKHDFFPSIKRL